MGIGILLRFPLPNKWLKIGQRWRNKACVAHVVYVRGYSSINGLEIWAKLIVICSILPKGASWADAKEKVSIMPKDAGVAGIERRILWCQKTSCGGRQQDCKGRETLYSEWL